MKLTESQRNLLKNRIKKVIREAMFENGYYEKYGNAAIFMPQKQVEKKNHITYIIQKKNQAMSPMVVKKEVK